MLVRYRGGILEIARTSLRVFVALIRKITGGMNKHEVRKKDRVH
jgi:hypothetical protein